MYSSTYQLAFFFTEKINRRKINMRSRFEDAHKAKALRHTALGSSVGEGCGAVMRIKEEEADRLMREMTRVKSSA